MLFYSFKKIFFCTSATGYSGGYSRVFRTLVATHAHTYTGVPAPRVEEMVTPPPAPYLWFRWRRRRLGVPYGFAGASPQQGAPRPRVPLPHGRVVPPQVMAEKHRVDGLHLLVITPRCTPPGACTGSSIPSSCVSERPLAGRCSCSTLPSRQRQACA
jgi:hypothetical protein